MFKKLLSNLPFNPSLITQVSFYYQRMRKESSIRRMGLVTMVLAMLVQIFASLVPPEYSLAASANDIIYGGVNSVTELRTAYDTNAQGDVRNIFNQFGVGVDQINAAVDSSVDTRGANVSKYYSIGRTIGSRSDSFQISITGGSSTPIYMRTLGGWAEKVWPAYELPSTRYGRVWVLKDCGNIVTEGIPPMGNPNLAIYKEAEPGNNSTVNPGDRIRYHLWFSNKGDGPANNFYVQDMIPAQVTNIEVGESGAYEYINGSTFTAYWDELPKPSVLGGDPVQEYQVNFWVTVRPDAGPGTFCNQALASSVEMIVYSNQVCHVIPACPYNPSITPTNPACQPPPPPPTPIAECSLLNARYLSRTKVEFEAIATAANGATINSFEFNTGTKTERITPTTTTGTVSQKFVFDYPGTPAPFSYQASVTAVSSIGNKTSPACSRTIEIEKEKQPIVITEKSVGRTPDALSSKLKVDPGQDFTYFFTVKNVGDADATNYVIPEDNITDTLEYADVVNAGDAEIVKQSNQATHLRWQPLTVKPGETIVKSATFKLKPTLPKTNTPPSNPQSFNCQIENSISSSTVIIDIDKANCVTKVIEQTVTTLPNTGPGTSLMIGFSITFFVAYFFYRSRLMAEELGIVRRSFASSGGQ